MSEREWRKKKGRSEEGSGKWREEITKRKKEKQRRETNEIEFVMKTKNK